MAQLKKHTAEQAGSGETYRYCTRCIDRWVSKIKSEEANMHPECKAELDRIMHTPPKVSFDDP